MTERTRYYVIHCWRSSLAPHLRGMLVRESRGKQHPGVLFNPGRGSATLYGTRAQAEAAIRRTNAHWNDSFDDYKIVPVTTPKKKDA